MKYITIKSSIDFTTFSLLDVSRLFTQKYGKSILDDFIDVRWDGNKNLFNTRYSAN